MARRFRRDIIVLLTVAVLGVVAGPPLLRALAKPLIVDEPEGQARYLCVHGSDYGVDGSRCFDRATAWLQGAPGRRILILPCRPERVVEIGAIPSFAQVARRELLARGVKADDIEMMPGGARDEWDKAHRLDDWLAEHRDEEILLACSRFGSGRIRYVLDHVLEGDRAARIRVFPMARSSRNETNWWRSRAGVKDLMFAWLNRICTWTQGEQRVAPERLSAAEYQSLLRKTFGEAPR